MSSPSFPSIPSADTGKNLFDAGVTINNSTRFRDMHEVGSELFSYFNWERSCLIAYAHSLSVIRGTAAVCNAVTRTGDACRGTVAEMPSTGVVFGAEWKCIACGARPAVPTSYREEALFREGRNASENPR